MYIKPVDYVHLITKAQEVSKIRQPEVNKSIVHFDNSLRQQERQVKENQKKVLNANKGESIVINENNENDGRNNKYYKKDKQSKGKEKNESKENGKLGRSTLDIKV